MNTELPLVLVIEDDETSMKAYKAHIGLMPVRALFATTSVEAYNLLAGRRLAGHVFDLVISDNQMPRRTGDNPRENEGLWLLRNVRRNLSRTMPFVLFTSDDSTPEIEAAIVAYNITYFKKDQITIRKIIERVMEKSTVS